MLFLVGWNIPNGANGFSLLDLLSDFETLLDLSNGARSDGLFDEEGNPREVVENLGFDVPPRLESSSEHRGTAYNESAGTEILGHVLEIVVEVFEDTSVLVGGNDERVAFLSEDFFGAFGSRVYESDNLETTAKFAAMERLAALDMK